LAACVLAGGALVCAGQARAQDSDWAAGDAEQAKPLWELGVAGIGASQLAYPGAASSVRRGLVLPYVIYRGKRWFAGEGGAGLRAFKSRDWSVDLGVAAAFAAPSDAVEARQGLPDLGTMVELGPRLKWRLGEDRHGGRWQFNLPVRAVLDLDHGLAYKGVVAEPTISLSHRWPQAWRTSVGLGWVMGNRALADTFYTVTPAQATAQRPAYAAQAGWVSWRLSLRAAKQVNPDLRVFGFVRTESVQGAANASSPLVQRRVGTSVGLGFVYTFARAEELVSGR
jgi:hypothetical protein